MWKDMSQEQVITNLNDAITKLVEQQQILQDKIKEKDKKIEELTIKLKKSRIICGDILEGKRNDIPDDIPDMTEYDGQGRLWNESYNDPGSTEYIMIKNEKPDNKFIKKVQW